MKKSKRLYRRGLALALSLVMCVGMLQLPALAAEGSTSVDSVAETVEIPDETPDETPVETPDETPEETPDETPEETPDETPAETPDEAPAETPDEAPVETPDEAPDETPAETPDEAPAETPDEGPAETPDEGPAETPDETPAETPDEAPVETPVETPDEAPEEPVAPPTLGDLTQDAGAAAGDVITDLVEDLLEAVIPVPAEVQRFLDAVAAIPAVNPDNAEWIMEYLYGEVSTAYEALLGTVYEDRADVQSAVTAMAQALRVAEELLEIASSTYDIVTKTDNVIKTAYSQFNPNTNTSNTVNNGFAQNGYGTVVLDDENPTATDVAFCHYWGAHIAGWPNGFQMIAIEKNTNPSVATAKARSTENGLVVDFTKGTGTGTTTIVVGFTITTLRPTANIASSGQTYAGFSGYLYYTVTNDGTGTVVKPDKPTVNDLPSANASQKGYVYVKCVTYPNANPLYNSTATHAGFMSLKNSTAGWSFGEVYENDGRFGSDAPASQYPWLCDLTVNSEYYLGRWNANYASTKGGIHYLNDKNDIVKATFVSDGSEWYFFTDDFPLTVWITHEVPVQATYTVIYTDGVDGEEVFKDQRTDQLSEGAQTPEFKGTPSRDGYTFMGWAPAVNLVVSADDANEDGEIIYTATWQKDGDTESKTTYKIVREYYVNGEKNATVTSGPKDGTVGDTIEGADLNSKNPNWVNYTVDGEKLTFTYKESSPETLTLGEDSAKNVITLIYVIDEEGDDDADADADADA
ncbi:hypothetical protein D1646_21535, partial [Pseudoflavonifractor sp. 60]|nr:hypothetical protein [Pseudoflavonifractor sp. 60]